MSVGSDRPEADEWGLDCGCELILPLPCEDSSYRKKTEAYLSFLLSHRQTEPYKDPLGVSATDRWSVSSEQRWQFHLIHSLEAKLGSQSQIQERTLVTRAETWKRPDGNRPVQRQNGGRKSGIRVLTTFFCCEPQALMAIIKSRMFCLRRSSAIILHVFLPSFESLYLGYKSSLLSKCLPAWMCLAP